MSLEYDPVYLQKDVCAALQAWPEEPAPAMQALLASAAILNKGELTAFGAAFLKWVTTRDFSSSDLTMRFFTLDSVLSCWPIEMLSDRFKPITTFLSFFALDWNAPDVRRFIAKNLDKPRRSHRGFWANPEGAAADPVEPPLLDLFAALGAAFEDNHSVRIGSNFHGK